MKLYEKIGRHLAENTYGYHSDFVDGKTLVDTHWRLWKTDGIISTKAVLSWLKESPPNSSRENLIKLIEEELKNV